MHFGDNYFTVDVFSLATSYIKQCNIRVQIIAVLSLSMHRVHDLMNGNVLFVGLIQSVLGFIFPLHCPFSHALSHGLFF